MFKKNLGIIMVLIWVISFSSAFAENRQTVYYSDGCFLDGLYVVVDSYGVTFSEDKTMLVKYPEDKTDETYTIPDSVTRIRKNTFAHNNYLTHIDIPENVTQIDESAFFDCKNLVSVTLPKNIEYLENDVFYDCKSLKNVTLPDNLLYIPENTFKNCTSLETILLPESVVSISASAFSGCSSLKNVSFPKTLNFIGANAFFKCSSLSSISIPDGTETIGNYAFAMCTSLSDITIPSTVTGFGNDAFFGCSALTSITLPSGTTVISDRLFQKCTSLKEFTIPETVYSIGADAFSGCTSLTSVTIPERVTDISVNAFTDCTSLTDVYYGATETEWNDIGFSFDSNLTIHYTENTDGKIKLTLFGKKLFLDEPMIIENGRTLVPTDTFFNRLYSHISKTDYFAVTRNESAQTIKVYHGDNQIDFKLNSTEMKINDRITLLDVPPRKINGITYIPLRAVSEAFGLSVEWIPDIPMVRISN